MPRSGVFISYSHKDEQWLEELRPFLKSLERDSALKIWDDTRIAPGAKWRDSVKQALQQSKVATLLVTEHFLASDFIVDEELHHFLQASENEGLTIWWVAVSPSSCQESPLAEFQCVNHPEKPLDSLSRSELQRELVKIAKTILQSTRASGPEIALLGAHSAKGIKQTSHTLDEDWPGFITGAQASLRARAETALRESAPLLQSLSPLDPEVNERKVAMLKDTVQREMKKLVEELGRPGLPSPSVVGVCFKSLLGHDAATINPAEIESDPDRVGGSLGMLRDECGLMSSVFVDTIGDENNVTKFRIIVDSVNSLFWSFVKNLNSFGPTTSHVSLGTQLYYLWNQLAAVAESLESLRSVLDASSIGRARRRALLLEFLRAGTPIFLEDLLSRIEQFATDVGPQLIRTGDTHALRQSFIPEIGQLRELVKEARVPVNIRSLPDSYRSERVMLALDDLHDELSELNRLVRPRLSVHPGQ